MNHLPSILIFGSAPDLIETRRLVLKHAGFDVTVSLSLDHVTDLLASRDFDLFILCHSLSPSQSESALLEVHTLRPKTKNLILSKALTSRVTDKDDTVLAAFASPQTLIAAAKSLIYHSIPEPRPTPTPPLQDSHDIL